MQARLLLLNFDFSLCNIFGYSLDIKLQFQFRPFKTCYKVWAKAKITYYNDVNLLYKDLSNLISMKKDDMDMQSYIRKLNILIVYFDAIIPLIVNCRQSC